MERPVTCFSLHELIVEGRLGGAAVGMGRAEVRAQLGEPDDWGVGQTTVERAEIWQYGSFELHFNAGGRCWLIFSDHVQHGLEAGPGRTLDLWLLADDPERAVAAARLRASGATVDERDDHDTRCLRIGNTKLLFDADHLAVVDVTGDERP